MKQLVTSKDLQPEYDDLQKRVNCAFIEPDPRWYERITEILRLDAAETEAAKLRQKLADSDLVFAHANEIVGKLQAENKRLTAQVGELTKPVSDSEASVIHKAMAMLVDRSHYSAKESLSAIIATRASAAIPAPKKEGESC